ncbi:MAG: RluA family pseudouridine synthase [Synergistaceae bacterium]|nr:RluA family pseudouridine synthase [Synergistaceae bacterium]
MSFSLRLSRDHDGRRLDRTLRSIWPAVPLSAIMRALRKGEIRLDSARVREPGTRVLAGQELVVPWEAPGERGEKIFIRRYAPIPVLWKGESAIIVNKPEDLLVQPDVKGGDSVITRVWNQIGVLDDPTIPRPAAAHRLDRNTTGALVVALRGDALRALEALFKARKVKKRYLAIVEGCAPDFLNIEAPLLKDAEANTVRVAKISEGARPALTRCSRLTGDDETAADDMLSLVSVELVTGRTHQARVHLAHIGCPILGDRKYGDFIINRRWKNVHRPLLHAFELRFPEEVPPVLSELAGRTFRAPVPLDMRTIIERRDWEVPELTEAMG